MSYFNEIQVGATDSPSVDAYGRWRTVSPYAIFDNKQLYDAGPIVWSTLITGNATSSFSQKDACTFLYASQGGSVIRQTKKRNIYQPGKSHMVLHTTNFSGSYTGCIKRSGLFDSGNGMYFVASGSSFGVGLRTSTSGIPVDTFISQSDWNLDKFDGTGISGRTLNLNSSQIFFKDFEWLGTGRVRYGIYQDGTPFYVHQIINTNTVNTVYISTPNLPIRHEIYNYGPTRQSMVNICSTVISEGGAENNGNIRSISNTEAIGLTAGNEYGIIALRLKPTSIDSNVVPIHASIATTATNTAYEVNFLINPSGSLPWVWQDMPYSNMQYATASSNAYKIANEGIKIFNKVGSAQNSSLEILPDAQQGIGIGADINGTPDILVLGVKDIIGNMNSVIGTITWRES